jgi:C-terminal processing protease CtpA/Prc
LPTQLKPLRILSCLVLFLILCSSVRAAPGEGGWFGLALKVNADGFFHPVVRSISVEKVWPDSPAARAGLAAGDAVLEVQGVKVAGATPAQLKPALQTAVGQTLRLKVQHGSTPPAEIVLKAAPKPPS